MATKAKSKRSNRADLLRRAKLHMKESPWIAQIGLGPKDVVEWLVEDAEVVSAVTHGDLRRRSGHTLRRHAFGMDARYSTVKRIEATKAKNLKVRELSRFVEFLGLRFKVYAYDGRKRMRLRIW